MTSSVLAGRVRREIKKAYRKLAFNITPTEPGNKEGEETFKKISEAYAVLGDQEKRHRYNRFGSADDLGSVLILVFRAISITSSTTFSMIFLVRRNSNAAERVMTQI
jgi:DnaJ-class molecular chaperone